MNDMRELMRMMETWAEKSVNVENYGPELLEALSYLDEAADSNLPFTDEDMASAPLPSNVQAKLFANRHLPQGKLVAVRLNLNGKISANGGTYFLQTVHDRTTSGPALGYDGAVTVRNAYFQVSQVARANIATKRENKYPMAGVVGNIAQVDPDLSGVEVRFNPMAEHLFVRADDGRAVKSADEVTVFNTRCFVRGKIVYWSEDKAPKPLEGVPTGVRYHVDEGNEELQPPAASFTTSKGSVYELMDDGSTIRTKKVDNAGLQPKSEKTVYLTKENVNKSFPAVDKYMVVDHGDGILSVATYNEANQAWGFSPSMKDIPYSTTPEIDHSPLELWKGKPMMHGATGYTSAHWGHPIVEIRNGLVEAGAGPSRIIRHIRDGKQFFMISAMRANLSSSENIKRDNLLRKNLSALPVSFIRTGGEYHEVGQDEPSEENSYFVMPSTNMLTDTKFDRFIEFGKSLMTVFQQDSILYGDGQDVRILENGGDDYSIGNSISFDPMIVSNAPGFSKLKDRKFSFTSSDEAPKSTRYAVDKPQVDIEKKKVA